MILVLCVLLVFIIKVNFKHKKRQQYSKSLCTCCLASAIVSMSLLRLISSMPSSSSTMDCLRAKF
jgi:hypothetical protein